MTNQLIPKTHQHLAGKKYMKTRLCETELNNIALNYQSNILKSLTNSVNAKAERQGCNAYSQSAICTDNVGTQKVFSSLR